MKFHCDRCKTRYSISDDRVRGKILKIRCKNCSAVITVREGMPQPDPTSTATPRAPEATAGNGTNGHGASRRAATRSADSQVIARRVISPTATDPGRRTGTGQTGSRRGATSNPALQGAFEKVLSSPSISPSESLPIAPPETYDVEWYVSIDGDQLGPYTLEEAQAWVRGKRADDELYCWSEGFDDWLLIDKVSHFRNLRAALPEPPLSYMDEKTAIGAPDFEDYASHMTAPAAAAPMPIRHAPAVPLVAAATRAGSTARTPQPQAQAREAFLPAKTPTPQPLFARTLEQVEANAATRVEEMVPGNGAKKNDLIQMPPAEDTVEAELDLNISEASRVVKLPMFAQLALQDRPPVAPTNGSGGHAPALPGLGGGHTGSNNKIGYGSGQFGVLRAQTGAQIALGDFEAPRPELLLPKKRKLPLWIPVGVAAAVLVIVVTLLVVLATRGDETEAPIARTGSGSSELAKSYTDPITKKIETAKEEVAAREEERPSSGGPRGSSGRRSSRESSGGAVATQRPAAGTGEVALGGEDAVVQGYLDPLEVTSAYRKYQINIKRCYETALKRDPFLVVPKTQVQISVAPGGSVTGVSIPSLSRSPLGNCLAGSIKKWKFKKSTKGLNTAFEVMFKS